MRCRHQIKTILRRYSDVIEVVDFLSSSREVILAQQIAADDRPTLHVVEGRLWIRLLHGVKGGVKPDHRSGVKVDQRRG